MRKREARMAKEELSGRIKEREGELQDLRYHAVAVPRLVFDSATRAL